MANTQVSKIMIRGAAIIFYLMKAPRTRGEMSLLLGFKSARAGYAVVDRWFSVLEEEGLVRRLNKLRPTFATPTRAGRPAVQYEWVGLEEITDETTDRITAPGVSPRKPPVRTGS